MRSQRSSFVAMAFAVAFGACEGATTSSSEFAPAASNEVGDPTNFDFMSEPMEIAVDGTVSSITAEMCHADPNKVMFGRRFSCTVPTTGKVYEVGEVVELMYVQFMVPGTVTVTSELAAGKPKSWTIAEDAFLCWDVMQGVPADSGDYPTLWPSVEIPVVCGEGAYTVSISNDVDVCAYFKIGNGGLTWNVLAYEFGEVGGYDPKLNGEAYADFMFPVDGGEEVTMVVAPIFE